MDMKMIRTILENAVDTPLLFLAYVALVFAVLVLIGCFIVYWTARAINKKTQMTGLMQMSVALNRWPDDTQDAQSPMLNLGSYLIGMQDPAKIVKNRLDPALTGLEAAQCRRYSVSVLLDRFRSAFDGSGFAGDPASVLLGELLYDEHFCEQLGQISRKNAKHGLRVHTDAVSKKEGGSQDKVSIFYTIPSRMGERFGNELQCTVKTLCITLDYSVR